jgi:four helix bundle protein
MRDHTSLLAWQEARATALEAILLCRDHWVPYGAAIFAQLQRASLSVQLNIAEGYAFTRSATLQRHYRIAYGSAIETGELLQVLVDSEIVGRERCRDISGRNARTQRLLLGLLHSNRNRD